MKNIAIILLLFVCISLPSYASHVMGGEITWKCVGGNYVFQLIYYRDCNGADVNTVAVNLNVWNHPSLNNINLNFISRQDISPYCNSVPTSPSALACGNGTAGGNGVGAIEKIIYRSNPISIPGTPPADGWIFTYQDFSRSGAITNFTNPSSYGITLTAKMFPISGTSSGCIDSSPIFLQEPYFVSCIGTPFQYSSNAIDPDLDSTVVEFGIPLNNFPSGSSYNPPINPIPVPFEPGFSYLSPTPDAAFNSSNIAATLNNNTGQLDFTCFTQGNYNIKLVAKSYRNGILIALVEREMQLIVTACNNQNNAPNIIAPFPGNSFVANVIAGNPINFTLSSTDLEILQDGSPQHNILTTTGPMYGTGYTSTTGCDIAPCATLNSAPSISGIQGVSVDFSWQTTCDHLANQYGVVANIVPYNFVFKIQDDYCQVPKVKYATVTINVINPGVIPEPTIDCIQTDANGNTTITWSEVSNPDNSFVEYQVHSIQNGLLSTITQIDSTSFVDSNTSSENDYFITVLSGCNGNTPRHSDTISSIFLDVVNPVNGTALLNWNDPYPTLQASMNDYYYIYREYPIGNWVIRDSVLYGTHSFIDTIDVCSSQLNYKIILKNNPCDYISNIDGDLFQDLITPDIPEIQAVSIDTLTNAIHISWNQNNKPDTYGYIVYIIDNNGFITELDTVWGIASTNYSYFPDITTGSFTYSVAAFDSCHLASNPLSYQTSAKANPHTSIFLTSNLDYCENIVTLNWSAYLGFNNLAGYEIWTHKQGQPWSLVGSTTNLTYEYQANPQDVDYFVVKAFTFDGHISFSNPKNLLIAAPTQAQFNYIRVGTVDNDQIELKVLIDDQANVKAVALEKFNLTSFIEIQRKSLTGNSLTFYDEDVQVDRYNYQYRTIVIDSCGNSGLISNTVKPMLLKINTDSTKVINYLHWTPYSEYAGSMLAYNIYRGINNIVDPTPIASVSSAQNYYTDLVEYNTDLMQTGQLCYVIEAVESMNQYGFKEYARSNMVKKVENPLIYLPNSFSPDGNEFNQEFIPIFTFFDINRFEFTIYDRWEHVVFSSTDYTEGWNGQILNTGRQAETGTYLYRLSVYDGNGHEVVKRGYVNLIR
ncbi:MAG: gliding motility-associated C-terminal domain-containing protein [Flavobacteriia bacterium]|nr:gliding motility-associated C-terminal domain-containing protein [Flavobacteriia bacterium]